MRGFFNRFPYGWSVIASGIPENMAPSEPSGQPRNPGMMFCRGCGGNIHETATMCPHCGYTEQQKDMERCWQCGNLVHVAARVCPHCGYTGTINDSGGAAVPWAYIAALLLPFVGIGFGIYLLVKQKFGHGIVVIFLSGIMLSFWVSFSNAFWVSFLLSP